MKSELGPLHLTQTNSPKERGASHLTRTGLVQPRHPSVVFRIRTRSMRYGYTTSRYDGPGPWHLQMQIWLWNDVAFRDECNLNLYHDDNRFIHGRVSRDHDEEFRPRLSRFVSKEEYILQLTIHDLELRQSTSILVQELGMREIQIIWRPECDSTIHQSDIFVIQLETDKATRES